MWNQRQYISVETWVDDFGKLRREKDKDALVKAYKQWRDKKQAAFAKAATNTCLFKVMELE